MRSFSRANGLVAVLLLSACSGNYSGGTATSGNNGGTDSGTPSKTVQEFFGKSAQTNLNNCRTCHVPGGVADTDEGKLFMLSSNPNEDYDNVYDSWIALDKGVETNKILTNPSDPAQHHSGGQPWPVGSQPYNALKVVLGCWENPDSCAALLASNVSTPTAPLALLGSARGGHAWFDFCEGKSDSTVLPADPRSLVQPGINANKAVYYNAFWKDCHREPEKVGEAAPAKTCGELRTLSAQGRTLIEGNGAIGAGWYFGGNGSKGNLTAAKYNTVWEKWGLPSRPDNFDQLVAERYGMGMGAARNPYPLPGEDPNKTNGGTGQLPTGLTQTHDAEGRWTGNIGTNCHVCHSGQVGTPADGPGLGALYGNSNSLSEFGQLDTDLGGSAVPGVPIPVPIIVGKTRGTNNALALQIITFLVAGDLRPLDPNFIGFTVFTPNGGSLDTPAWWNMGHRPTKFQDGFLAMDALRADFGFFLPGPGPDGFGWVKEHVRAGDTWLMSLKSPAFPGPINTALAEQGAVLFHSKNLWAEGLDNPSPKPEGGNGSCASCHGAYSPRYVNDSRYLDTPALEGVASYIVPRDLIATDKWRVDSDSEAAEQYGKEDFFAYPETINSDPNLDCSTQNRAEIRQGRAPGYLAPPLYGVWASGPYLHNGSVPNVMEILNPAERKSIWRRVSTPARFDQLGKVVMGYDTNFQRAYDKEKLGWKYDALACGAPGTTPYLDCDPANQDADPALGQMINILNSSNPFLWYLGLAPSTDQQLENRKIYNTHMYGQSNVGHTFTSVLNEQERKAILEYLKTL
ncbi:hypothetical protein [Stenotrophobium rhamnosiphilum]|uniref:c-type cytochrome n=1 Tax=Stenotrophobium rhamnosiphilum TaxID=2029166 RepID=UPI0011B205D0|nr:hypothetical protein [Stenotrophobium rhamnosiphilum]